LTDPPLAAASSIAAALTDLSDVIDVQLFAVVVGMSIFTTLLVPAVLRRVAPG
jgi:hypothetical protein